MLIPHSFIGPLGEDSEEIPIDDVDKLEELAEDEVEHKDL